MTVNDDGHGTFIETVAGSKLPRQRQSLTSIAPSASMAPDNVAGRRHLVFFLFSIGALLVVLQQQSSLFQHTDMYNEGLILLETISKNMNTTALAVTTYVNTTVIQQEDSVNQTTLENSVNASALVMNADSKFKEAIKSDRFFVPAKMVESKLAINGDATSNVLPRPDLSSLVHNYSVISTNISWMLDFAVIGFPKCGTTSMLKHLGRHSLIHMHPREICALPFTRPDKLVEAMYKLPADTTKTRYSRGYKCPLETEYYNTAHKYYRDLFPNMRVLIGVRHPLLWFESFYNFRVFINGQRMPHPQKLLGTCGKGAHGVCASRGRFHFHLAQMGKTPLNTTEERSLLGNLKRLDPVKTDLQIFLYEISQLNDPHFLDHLQSFLHLGAPFPAMERFNHTLPSHMRRKNVEKLDICKPEYETVHKHFMDLAQQSSQWIQAYFLHSADVHFAPGLHEALDKWRTDPCIERRLKQEKSL